MSAAQTHPAVSVVVPLYNEAENVPILQNELTDALKGIDHEIIFVDDGSTDATLSRLTTTPQVRVLRFEKNAGQSAALYAGATAARGAFVSRRTLDKAPLFMPARRPRAAPPSS